MRRVLIVDDEPIIVQGLVSVLSESGLDIDLYSAYSGEEALALLSETRMDIVISDVHMPGMDGLQLMSRIRADWPECRVIFLSGHSEFDTIYRAVQGDAVTFLLKTEGFDRIITTLENTMLQLDQAQRHRETRQQLINQQAVTRQLMQREALSALVEGTTRQVSPAAMKTDALDISLKQPLLLLYAYMEGDTQALTLEEFHERLLAADRALRRQLAPYPIRIAFWNRHQDLLWLLQPDPELDMGRCMRYVRENLDLVQSAALSEARLTLSFALHTSAVAPEQLASAYQALRQRVCQGPGLPGMIALQAPDARVSDAVPLLPDSALSRLQDAMDHLNRKEFMALLNRAADALRRREDMNDPYALEAYLSLSRLFLAYINRWKLHDSIQYPGGLPGLTAASGFSSWQQAADALVELGQLLFRISANDQGSRSQSVIQQIKAYIERNLNRPEELSLSRIAGITFFNPTYLSRLVHQVTGETLSDYISAVRIRRANQLLKNSSVRINDVGEAVGFSSTANFCRFYRKMMGCSPQEYRDRLAHSTLDTPAQP